MDSELSTKIQKQKISRERRKELKNRLKKELGDRMRFVYIASFLSWIQFLMRIISFGFIAKGFSNLYNNTEFSLFTYVIIVIGLNILGYFERLNFLNSGFENKTIVNPIKILAKNINP